MISEPSPHAKIPTRFAQAPGNEHTAFWRPLDEQLPHHHLADRPPTSSHTRSAAARPEASLKIDT